MDVKKTMRKMSVVLTGAAMVGATVMGAMADLSDYPSPFIVDGFFVGKIVIGEKSMPSDMIGATDIAAQLQADSKTPVEVGNDGTVTVSGGKTEEVDIGTDLADAFGTLDNNDIEALKEGILTISTEDADEEYDYHEEITFSSGATIDSGLTATEGEDDFKDGVYLLMTSEAVSYHVVFDDDLVEDNRISDASADYPIYLEFLGKELEITSADNDSITVQVGETIYLDAGQKATISGKEVTLVKVGDSSAIVTVGTAPAQTINVGSTKTVGGLKVKVKEVFNDEGVTYDSATLIVGTEAIKSYNDGEEFIGEDEDDPLWVWDLAGLETDTPTIGITNDLTFYGMNDNPITLGESLALPNDYAKIMLDSFNVAGYKKYTVEAESGIKLRDADGEEIVASAKVLLFSAADGEEDGFSITDDDSDTFETDEIALYMDAADTVDVFYKDHDDNKYKLALDDVDFSADVAEGDLFTIQYKDTEIEVSWDVDTRYLLFDDIGVYVADAADAFDYLGEDDGDDSPNEDDVQYDGNEIESWEEDTLTPDGVIIHSYDATASSDEFSFSVPRDNVDFAVNVVVVGGSGSVVAGGGNSGAYTINPLPLGSTILDKDAMNMIGTTPLIVVGGPGANTVAASLMGNPTYEQIVEMFTPGLAKIKLYPDKNALLVAGYGAQDTLGAAFVLAEYDTYTMTGNEVEVVVPSLTGVYIRAPTTN